MDVREHVDISLIGGNVSTKLKQAFFDAFFARIKNAKAKRYKGFEPEIASRTEPEKLEARTVFEISVGEDMVNLNGALHGGCSALLIDNCSRMPVILLGLATTGRVEFGVSKSLNILYHGPAMVGDRLRIVSTTLSYGSRVLTSCCEIWDATNHRLVASGVHTIMLASTTKSTAKL
ncbi:HotDog domain-containing protein [Pisolithus tinctorius]|nr:HotDog domain-containing protein [Pisolithus tinctorius]